VVLRRLLSCGFKEFGPSYDLLAALIGTAEQLFLLNLGRLPFEFDDNRLHLQAMHSLARNLFNVAEDLGQSPASRSYIPRLRGLEAQLELQWPRLSPEAKGERWMPVVGNQSNLVVSGGHPADWIRAALRALGDSAEARPFSKAAAMRRLEASFPAPWRTAPELGRVVPPAERAAAPGCPRCGGRGFEPCRECDGSGRRAAHSVIRSMQTKWKKDPATTSCIVCAATGEMLCWTCAGTGEEPPHLRGG
jgi:hypothetical protein